METKYIIIGIIIVIIIGIGIYFMTASESGFDIENDESAGQPPEFPDEGMSADVLKIFENPEDVGNPPTFP